MLCCGKVVAWARNAGAGMRGEQEDRRTGGMTGGAALAAGGALTHRDIPVILSGILLGMMLAALDQSIVATALPAIAGELDGLEHLSWIVAGYLLTSTASTPIYGKLSDLYGAPCSAGDRHRHFRCRVGAVRSRPKHAGAHRRAGAARPRRRRTYQHGASRHR